MTMDSIYQRAIQFLNVNLSNRIAQKYKDNFSKLRINKNKVN